MRMVMILTVVLLTTIMGCASTGVHSGDSPPGVPPSVVSPSGISPAGVFSTEHKGNLGMDISHWSYPIDFAQSRAAGIQFVYMKCGGASLDGSYYIQDSQFTLKNIQAARNAGLKIGFYWYKNPDLGGKNAVSDAITEADLFYSYIYNITGSMDMGDLFPVLDFEDPNSGINSITGDQAYLWLQNFSEEFKAKSGRQIMLYTYYYTVATLEGRFNIDTAALMPLWLAATDTSPDDNKEFGGYKNWLVLQYQDNVSGYGTSGAIDLDDADLSTIVTPITP